MTYNYKKYEFTAFTEADFLGQGGNGSSIGCGDSFTMPASATVCLSTWDNDSSLSGDSYCNENSNDSSGQKAIVDGARVGSQMYAESYHVLHGSDGKTYYMIEIEVEGYDAPGAGDDFFTFYGAVPPAGVELTVAQTCNVKGNWVDFNCIGAGEKAPANEAPTFTNVPSDGIICVDENQTFVIDLAATDADGDTLTYEIVGGADASAFTIDAHTGELTFTAGPDYEAPTDGNGNNVYDVTVKVSDGKGGEEIKPLWIKVKDVDESTGGTCFVVEAEDMQLCGYRVEHNDNASGDQVIKGSACGWASAKTTFDGPEGTYDLKLSVIDENDGNGRICVSVNGQWVLDVRLDQNDGGNGVSNSTFRELMINDIDLKPGDVVKIWGLGNNGEYARIDKLEFCSEKTDPMTAELGDTVWFDTDKDGIQDGDEIGAAGVTVLLKDASGKTIDQTETDANGNYLFSGLAAGDYKVCVVAPGAFAFTGQNAGDDAADSDVMANGMSDLVTLGEGESNLTVDAGLVDPGTASLEGRVFCDENDNDIRDAGDGPVDNVKVTLLTAAGVVVATTTTAADGTYSFTGLDAGDYKVSFDGNTVDGKLFVGTDAGSDDTVDSDADTNGMTGVYTLNIGDKETDVDAGVEFANVAPEANADALKTCANAGSKTVDLLANDRDADGDILSVLSISDADEMAFVGESLTLDSGATVTLNADGTVSYDTNGVHDALLVGSEFAEETVTYTVSDGNGDTGTSTLDVTVCGAASTLQMICDSLPAQVDLSIAFDGVDYKITVADDASTTADDGLASSTWSGACIDIYGQLLLDQDLTVNVYGTCGTIPDGLIQNPENLDLINWILNEEFIGQDNMDASAQYTIFDVQEAVWALSDGTATSNANANEIVAKAEASGEGFVSGEGDLVAVIFDPIAPDASVTDTQTFIMGVEWDALALDCIC